MPLPQRQSAKDRIEVAPTTGDKVVEVGPVADRHLKDEVLDAAAFHKALNCAMFEAEYFGRPVRRLTEADNSRAVRRLEERVEVARPLGWGRSG
ncbi:MAG: hypothetical protein ABI910_19395 [Gemmatimonadota bacterium]